MKEDELFTYAVYAALDEIGKSGTCFPFAMVVDDGKPARLFAKNRTPEEDLAFFRQNMKPGAVTQAYAIIWEDVVWEGVADSGKRAVFVESGTAFYPSDHLFAKVFTLKKPGIFSKSSKIILGKSILLDSSPSRLWSSV